MYTWQSHNIDNYLGKPQRLIYIRVQSLEQLAMCLIDLFLFIGRDGADLSCSLLPSDLHWLCFPNPVLSFLLDSIQFYAVPIIWLESPTGVLTCLIFSWVRYFSALNSRPLTQVFAIELLNPQNCVTNGPVPKGTPKGSAFSMRYSILPSLGQRWATSCHPLLILFIPRTS